MNSPGVNYKDHFGLSTVDFSIVLSWTPQCRCPVWYHSKRTTPLFSNLKVLESVKIQTCRSPAAAASHQQLCTGKPTGCFYCEVFIENAGVHNNIWPFFFAWTQNRGTTTNWRSPVSASIWTWRLNNMLVLYISAKQGHTEICIFLQNVSHHVQITCVVSSSSL